MTRGRDSLVCFVLFVNLLQNVIVLGQQQTGFISISCGSMDASHRDTKTGINYVSDVGTVSAGETAMIANEYITSVAKNLQHLRRFPFGRRNCIDNLGPVTPGSKYLLRASFMYGNYDALNSVPVFDFYLGTNFIQTVNGTVATPRTIELMFVATDTNVSVCLLKTTSGVPFISSIELRPMSMGGYTILNSTTAMLTRERFSFGTASREDIRYPDDVFDRLWTAPDSFIDSINTTESVKPSNNDFNPPSLVMQTAMINSSSNGDVQWNTFDLPLNASFYTCLHLAELQRLREGQIREFTITVSGTPFKTQQPAYLTSTTECSSSSYLLSPPGRNRVLLLPTARSTLSPILNAFELFQVIPLSSSVTDGQDVDALRTIKDNLKTKANWTGDPCLPQGYAWENIVCSNGSSPRVTSLDLSNSGLNGEIPSSLSKMSAIVSLNLANNNLTGSIPSFLGDLPKLNYLNLSGNSLSGAIPDALLTKNQSGSLLLSIDGNKDLCLSGPCGKKNTKSIVIGSVIAVVVLIVAACVATWMILRSRSKKRLEKESDKALGMPRGCKAFSYSELKSITNNFSTKIGEGGYGPVFHGHLQDGQDVAVKILSHKSTQGSKEFYTEVALLSRVHHKNLVTFFGYCDEAENMILVYEYISSGNLQDVISGSTQITLDWNQRLQIAFNAAQGLDYLHSGCKPAIIHRDIKCANILLNEKLEAKIADFGMSKSDIPDGATHISTVVVGTQGYLDPEYYLTNHINEKSDVFSFGVVLLELITGRQPIIVEPSGERTHIANWVRPRLLKGDLASIADPRLQGQYDTGSMWKLADTALECLATQAAKRPLMSEVVSNLKEAMDSCNTNYSATSGTVSGSVFTPPPGLPTGTYNTGSSIGGEDIQLSIVYDSPVAR